MIFFSIVERSRVKFNFSDYRVLDPRDVNLLLVDILARSSDLLLLLTCGVDCRSILGANIVALVQILCGVVAFPKEF